MNPLQSLLWGMLGAFAVDVLLALVVVVILYHASAEGQRQ